MILLCASPAGIIWFLVLMLVILPFGTVGIALIIIVQTIKLFRGDYNSKNQYSQVLENTSGAIEG
jgi:TRAP-type C4-dicarboxylate transport system permease small subunit